MKLAVYAHSMEVGGSQMNAIELAAAIQNAGHEVLLVGEDGPLEQKVAALGLEHYKISQSRRRPSPRVMAQLAQLVQKRSIDLIHAYEWPPVIDSLFGPGLFARTPVVATVMSGGVAHFLPRSISLIVGTEQLRKRCISAGYQHVNLLEPPIDTNENSPIIDGEGFRKAHEVPADSILLVVICRLVQELKLEGLLSACEAVERLASDGVPVRLIIVGDGKARSQVEVAANQANSAAGRTVVTLTGELLDPREAYAAADIVLGMGGSALRGMAFAKPLVVQGERGFWQLCTEQSLATFLESGWYGLGNENDDAAAKLCRELSPLLADAAYRHALGRFSRQVVVDRFSLQTAARVQESIYEEAMLDGIRMRPAETLATVWGVLRYKVDRRIQRVLGVIAEDDFNALKHM